MSRMRFAALVTGLFVSLSMPALVGAQQPKFAYVADFDHFEGFDLNPTTGAVGTQIIDNTTQPATAVAADPSGKFVYFADGLDDLVIAYAVDPTSGALTMVGSPLAAGCVDPIDGGQLPIWSVKVDPLDRFVYVLGFGDGGGDNSACITGYLVSPNTGGLTPISGGPFAKDNDSLSMTIDPTGNFLFVASAEGQISAYKINATTGALTLVPGSPFNNNTANQSGFHDITVSPSGKFLYTTRFTPDSSVLVFAINQTTGALTPAAGSPFAVGTSAASLAFDPSGQFAYVSDAQDLVVRQLSVNSTTGAVAIVSSAGVNVPPPNDFPTFVTLDPSGNFLYTVNVGFSITGFSVNQSTGGITIVPGSPFNSTSRETQMVEIDSAPAHCTPDFNVKPLPNTQSGPFNSTSEVCFEVTSTKPLFFNCSQMNARTVTVNGTLFQPAACNSSTGKSVKLAPASNNQYFFDVSAGSPSWASIAFWNQ